MTPNVLGLSWRCNWRGWKSMRGARGFMDGWMDYEKYLMAGCVRSSISNHLSGTRSIGLPVHKLCFDRIILYPSRQHQGEWKGVMRL